MIVSSARLGLATENCPVLCTKERTSIHLHSVTTFSSLRTTIHIHSHSVTTSITSYCNKLDVV